MIAEFRIELKVFQGVPMKFHDENIVDDVLDVLRDALNLYYDFKCLTELSDEQRDAIKGLIETYLEKRA